MKEAVKSNNGTTLRIGNKNFNKADLLHELFLTQTQTNKLREKVENNMSTDKKLSKAQFDSFEKRNLKLSNQQIKKLKEVVKSNNRKTLKIGNKNLNKAYLLQELFLTQTQINKLREKVQNNMSTDIKLSKAQINKLIKSGGALGSILARFLPKLIKPAILLGKNVLAPLGLSTAMSATDAVIKKMYGSGNSGTKTVKFSDKDMNGMIKNC